MEIKKGNLEKAEELYECIFIKTGNLKIRKALSSGEIARFLNKKSTFNKVFTKLKIASAFINKAAGSARKAFNTYDNICKMVNLGSRLYEKSKIKELDGSAEAYRKYFNETGEDFSVAMQNLSDFADYLPPGLSSLYKYTFSFADATRKVFSIGNSYAKKINTLADEAFEALGKPIGSNAKTPLSARRILKAGGDFQKALDAELGR